MDFNKIISVQGTTRSSQFIISPFLNYTENALIGRCFPQLTVECLLLIPVFTLSKPRARCFFLVLPNHEMIVFAFSGTLWNTLLVDSS